ncbi:tRNA lysidine(34) synthetase [Vulcanisaeta sp. JCM 14467]|uniref:tRNA lysidine(34) synthetase n=1 Tax=Vulcanisaeta sp. JCM 14467 TaxID=1295370 RepID=UPI0006D17BA9|nr:ATP-binding protein [Vulcanisaeta sp. JCM 14467]
MSVVVDFVQECRRAVVSGGSLSVRELLGEVRAGDATHVFVNGMLVRDFGVNLRAGDRVVVVRESIPGRCSVCGKSAFVRIPYARLTLCREHFLEFVRRRVGKVVEEYSLIRSGDTVMASVSGGKDSTAMLHILSELRKSLKFDLVALHIDQGLPGYSELARLAVEELSKMSGVPLVMITYRELFNMNFPDLVRRNRFGRPPCSICGLTRRYIYNAAAVELRASSVATGHHADDLAAYALKALLIHDYGSLVKLVPRTETMESGVAHIRPLYETYERETLLYSIAAELPFVAQPCPYKPRNVLEDRLKDMLNELERKHPGIKLGFLKGIVKNIDSFRTMARASGSGIGEVHLCKVCGLPASGDVCAFDRFTQRVLGSALGPHTREVVRVRIRGLGTGF